jgi:hypothetical protein
VLYGIDFTTTNTEYTHLLLFRHKDSNFLFGTTDYYGVTDGFIQRRIDDVDRDCSEQKLISHNLAASNHYWKTLNFVDMIYPVTEKENDALFILTLEIIIPIIKTIK